MTGGLARPGRSDELAMQSFWIPPNAAGNGLDADRWVEITEIDPGQAAGLLVALRAAAVPARAAFPRGTAGSGEVRVFVDPSRYAHAENVLLGFAVRQRGFG